MKGPLNTLPTVPQPAREDVVVLAPELFAAEGGIARVSRVYLEALAGITAGQLHLVVLNDRALPAERLLRHTRPAARPVRAAACGRSKLRFLRATLAATAGRATAATGIGGASATPRVLATHVHLLPVLLLARLLRPRLEWDVVLHGIEAWAPLPPLAALGLRRARRAYCVSQYTLDAVAALHPGAAGRLRVLPNAIDPALAASFAGIAATEAEPGRILAVSRLAPHDRPKGIDHLVLALPAVREREPRATLHIVGDGADRARLEDLAAASPARAAITFHGRLDEAALREQFARCRIFALPSEKEGFGLVYAEAMAAGRPCVAARAGGAPEVVGPDAGLLVPYGDISAIAQACIQALQRAWEPATLRARAERFNLASFNKSFTNLWQLP